jgi:hypothetical protein
MIINNNKFVVSNKILGWEVEIEMNIKIQMMIKNNNSSFLINIIFFNKKPYLFFLSWIFNLIKKQKELEWI